MKSIQERLGALDAKKAAIVTQAESLLEQKMVRLKRISDETVRCAELYNSGLTLEEVGAEVGRSSQTVRNRLLSIGVERRPQGDRKRTGEHHYEIIKLREEGKTYQEIGNVFGVTRERIRQILKLKRPDLCGRELKFEDRKCIGCEKMFRVLPSSKSKCCSSKCTGRARRLNTLTAHKDQIELALIMRKRGDTWAAIAHHLETHPTQILNLVKIAMDEGFIDVPDRNLIFPNGAGLA